MTSVRSLMIRGSMILNGILICYLCLSWWSVAPSTRNVMVRTSNLQMNDWDTQSGSLPFRRTLGSNNDVIKTAPINSDSRENSQQVLAANPAAFPLNSLRVSTSKLPPIKDAPPKLSAPSEQEPPSITGEREGGEYQEPPREVQESAGAPEQPPMIVAPLVEEGPDPPLDSLERKMYGDLRDCPTKPLRPHYTQKGVEYWILNNYIPAAMTFRCDESITYATHGDYTFLDNLDPLTSRWQGPVSVAVYAPGDDFKATIDTILYLRNCMAEGVKKYVTFHLFFHTSHVPKEIPTTENLLQRKSDCDKDPPKWVNVTTYRQVKKLLYPVNVARNTARENSQTYFHFVSDVELYPAINIIPEFFKMLKRPDASNTTDPRVFVFPIFEVAGNLHAPETKTDLLAMLKARKAIPFHKKICLKCHNQPKSEEWQKTTSNGNLSVFYVGKRMQPYHRWEPIFIGTDHEPVYDERLSWEGKSDKMSQMYILCVRNYEFHILNNVFLVHKPGIKSFHKDSTRDRLVARQNVVIRKKIVPEYRTVFGARKGCNMI